MSRLVKMVRYRLNQELWESKVSSQIASELGSLFQKDRFFGEPGSQYGFVSCRYEDGLVLGYFTHEGSKELVHYDSSTGLISDTATSFADMLFALHTASGIVAIQRTKIIGFSNLSVKRMRDEFPNALSQMLELLSIQIELNLQRERVGVSSQELYKIFEDYPTKSIVVGDLSHADIPSYDDFKIFNPRVEEDKIFRKVLGEDTSNGLDEVYLKAEQDEDLRSTALAKFLAYVGNLRSITIDAPESTTNVELNTKTTSTFRATISSNGMKERLTVNDVKRVLRRLLPIRDFVNRTTDDYLRTLIELSSTEDDDD